jgi:DNA-binding transcriptional ArsR family regulator
MSGLLRNETPPTAEDADPAVVGLDETDSGAVFSVLSSETARSLLAALYETPATKSELAEELDTSIQNVDYHVGNLLDADLVTVVEQWYSKKGNEMDVFAPANGPLVVVSGDSAQTDRTRNAVDLIDASD